MKISSFGTNESDWTNQLHGIRHDIYHRPEYVAADDKFRVVNSKLFTVSDNNNRLVVPLTITEIQDSSSLFDASSPYGYPAPLSNPDAPSDWIECALEVLTEHLLDLGVVSLFLRLHPLIGITKEAFGRFGRIVDHGTTVSIPLQTSFEEIRSNMRKTNRYEIRKGVREGQVAELDSKWNHFDDFYSIYIDTMNRLDAGPNYYFSMEYFASLRDRLPDNMFLWTTKIESEIAAASLITECNGIVQYHLSGTHQDYMRQYPTKVLLDAVAQWANERGNSHFHLGGGLGGKEDSLFNFKAGFGNGRHAFSTIRMILNPQEYQSLVGKWESESKIPADPVSGYFPAYRKPLENITI